MKIKIPAFATKKEMFAYLVKHKSEIIDLKKSTIKECDGFGLTEFEQEVFKGVNKDIANTDTDTEIKRTIVGNSYYWLDSHEDVHLSNCFGVSIKQRGADKINHLHDHLNQLDAKVGKFSAVYEKMLPWVALGVNKTGNTEALMADTTIKKSLNDKIFQQYKDGDIDQHSVGMMYDEIKLAVNDPEMEAEYAEWKKHIDMLGNKDKAEDLGYFWAVYKAKLREISCVIAASNELTPTFAHGTTDLAGAGQKTEQETSPSDDGEVKTFDINKLLNIFPN